MWSDSFLILFISIFTALLGEANGSLDQAEEDPNTGLKVFLAKLPRECDNSNKREEFRIAVLSVCTLILLGLTWLMVYRTEKYQKLKAEVERQSKRLEKKKEVHGDTVDRQQKKKIEREEEKLKNNNRDLSLVKMKSMFAIGFAFTALLSMFNSIFDGRVVAKLPFIPITWIHGLSHRNLIGEDYSDCSFIFLYILCTMSIRQNIQKLLGFAPSRTANKQSGNLFSPTPQPIK